MAVVLPDPGGPSRIVKSGEFIALMTKLLCSDVPSLSLSHKNSQSMVSSKLIPSGWFQCTLSIGSNSLSKSLCSGDGRHLSVSTAFNCFLSCAMFFGGYIISVSGTFSTRIRSFSRSSLLILIFPSLFFPALRLGLSHISKSPTSKRSKNVSATFSCSTKSSLYVFTDSFKINQVPFSLRFLTFS